MVSKTLLILRFDFNFCLFCYLDKMQHLLADCLRVMLGGRGAGRGAVNININNAFHLEK
jgi:hypothetical protein